MTKLDLRIISKQQKDVKNQMNMASFITNSYKIAEKNIDQFWNIYMLSLNNIDRAQEQLGQVFQDYMNKRNTNQAEYAAYFEKLTSQYVEHQKQYQNVMKEACSYWADNTAAIPKFNYFTNFNFD